MLGESFKVCFPEGKTEFKSLNILEIAVQILVIATHNPLLFDNLLAQIKNGVFETIQNRFAVRIIGMSDIIFPLGNKYRIWKISLILGNLLFKTGIQSCAAGGCSNS